MASLADLGQIWNQQEPAGFSLADAAISGEYSAIDADTSRSRLLRDFGQFDLPDLLGAQGARGAYNTSATKDKVGRLSTQATDQLTDISVGGSRAQAQLAANALLAQTGVQLGAV